MKITIDTKVDSPDDIRKIMQILGHFAGKDQNQRAYTNYNSNSQPNASSYGNTSTTPAPQPESTPNFSNFMGMMDQSSATTVEKKEEEKKEIPRIMTF